MKNVILPSFYPVACHTDHVGPGCIFVAIHGAKQDGIAYIPTALEKGARIIVIDQQAHLDEGTRVLIEHKNALLVRVENPRRALALLSAYAAGYPAERLKIIGITGTKGKTTTSFLLFHLLHTVGKRAALLSSVHNRIGETIFATELTTQHPDYLHVFFRACVLAGIEYVVMETAAQALTLERVCGLMFDGIIFTNFSQEHAEFYRTQEEYFQEKSRIFLQAKKDAPCLVNRDMPFFERLKDSWPLIEDFSLREPTAQHYARLLSSGWDGVQIELDDAGQSFALKTAHLIGDFNAYNVLAATSMARKLGVSPEQIMQGCMSFTGVPGRLALYELRNGARGIIDKAHNPSSFTAVLSTLRSLTDHLIVVFGAGGDRDATKRPVMGAIAAQFADAVIITSDNPRSEKVETIIEQIVAGIDENKRGNVLTIVDREAAIQQAYRLSKNGSIIALLGKGPDEYELVANVKTYFSEREILQSL